MDLNAINIKVDPGNSAAVLKEFVTGLTGAEARGKAAGESMLGLSGAFKSLATAMQQEQAALGRLNTLHEQLAVKNSGLVGSFNGLATAIHREQAMLEQINGPARKYMEDLQTLDALLERNVITTQQYAQQVRSMNAAMAETPVKNSGPSGLSGLATGALAGAGIIGSIALFQQLGSAIEGVQRAYQDASDHATEFENHAQKFVDSTHNVNQVMSDQQLLAHQLHAPLKDTMDLYDAIGDATSELNLSERQLLAITKNVGEATTIANKPLASAGDIINRLAVGFEAGGDASRSVKMLIAQYKDLADVWTSAFHTSKAGLLEMVKDHKISFDQMTLALATNTKDTEAAFALRHRTFSDERQELGELQDMYMAQGENAEDALKKAIDKFHELDAAVKPMSEHFALLRDNIASMATTLGKSTTMLQTWTQIAVSYGVANQSDLKLGGDYIASRERAMKDLAGLDQARTEGLIKGAGATEYYRKKWEELTTAIEGRLPAAYQIQMQLNDATLDFQRNIAGLDSLFEHHAIRLDQYTAKLHALSDAYAGPEIRKLFDQLNPGASAADLQAHQQASIAEDRGRTTYKAESVAPMTQTAAAAEKYRLELAQLNEMIQNGTVDQAEANNRLATYNLELNKGAGAVDANVQRQHDLQSMLDAIKKPQEDYSHDLSIVAQLYSDGAINAQQYADKVATIKDAYASTQKHSTDFATGLSHGWHDIVKDATDSAGQIETAMKGAFSAVEDSITNMVLKGQFDLNSLGSSLEQILVKLAVQQAVGGIVGAIGGGAVPHFATGGSGTIGGAGGTDSQLFIARVTPGEHYQFTPPGQMPEARKGGSTAGPGHTIVNLNYNPKAIQGGKDIEDGVMRTLRTNRSAIRALLGV